jgi:hypothetical protein
VLLPEVKDHKEDAKDAKDRHAGISRVLSSSAGVVSELLVACRERHREAFQLLQQPGFHETSIASIR